jgi:phospholipid transport system substrate-binding protein
VLVTGEFSDATGVRPPVTVNWRVTILPDKPPLVLDIEVQNISMLVTQKQENIAIIRQNKGNFSALIEAMREKNAE